MSYRVEIDQSHDFCTNNPKHLSYKFDSIQSIVIVPKCFSQIGHRSQCICGVNLAILPSGLTFPIFIDQDEDKKELGKTLAELNAFLFDIARDSIAVSFSSNKLPSGNRQNITIRKSLLNSIPEQITIPKEELMKILEKEEK